MSTSESTTTTTFFQQTVTTTTNTVADAARDEAGQRFGALRDRSGSIGDMNGSATRSRARSDSNRDIVDSTKSSAYAALRPNAERDSASRPGSATRRRSSSGKPNGLAGELHTYTINPVACAGDSSSAAAATGAAPMRPAEEWQRSDAPAAAPAPSQPANTNTFMAAAPAADPKPRDAPLADREQLAGANQWGDEAPVRQQQQQQQQQKAAETGRNKSRDLANDAADRPATDEAKQPTGGSTCCGDSDDKAVKEAKERAKAEEKAEKERRKAEEAAEKDRKKAEKAANGGTLCGSDDPAAREAKERAKAEEKAEKERKKAEEAAEKQREKAEKEMEKERAKADKERMKADKERMKAESALKEKESEARRKASAQLAADSEKEKALEALRLAEEKALKAHEAL